MFGVTLRRILQPFGADRTGRCTRSRLQSVVNSFIEEAKERDNSDGRSVAVFN
jgi:hypothetical protein